MLRGTRLSIALAGVVLAALCFAVAADAKAGGAHKNPAPAAKHWVAKKLKKRHLRPTRIKCHYAGGHAAACRFDAGRTVKYWPYTCRGHARYGAGRSRFGVCKLHGPDFAPLLTPDQVRDYQPAFGLNEDWADVLGRIDLASGLGSNTARVPFSWSAVESRPGARNWGAYDRVYTAMQARNISPIFAISDAPCWARPRTPCPSDIVYPPDRRHMKAWSRFVKDTVHRYPGIAGIEVWNEPNLKGFWAGKPSPRRYTKLLRSAYKAVKFVNKDIPVIFAGLVPQFGPAERGMDSRTFQNRAFHARAYKWFDAFGVHPYIFPSNDPFIFESVRAQLAIPMSIAAAYGRLRMPLWVTEFGLSTVGEGALSRADQAAKLVALYEMLRSVPGVPVVILHRLIDLDPYNRDWQAGMGLVNTNGTLKPAYCALAVARTGRCPYK